jgi:hypothetical protein
MLKPLLEKDWNFIFLQFTNYCNLEKKFNYISLQVFKFEIFISNY